MESVNKSFDVNKMFSGVENSFKKYNSVSSGKGNLFEKGEAWETLSAEVVSGLTDILKNVLSKPEYEEPKKTRSPIGFASLLTKSVIVMIHYGVLPDV